MAKYVPYVRTKEGYIERKSYAVFNASDNCLAPYVHEESLIGWPESKVYWASQAGPSVGLAPLNFRSYHISTAEKAPAELSVS
ncbi:MAG: hypothetical protein ABIR00_07180 [Nitrosospira sp.]